MPCQSGAEVEPPHSPLTHSRRRHHSRHSEEFQSAVSAVISPMHLDKSPVLFFDVTAHKPPLPRGDPAHIAPGGPPRSAADLQGSGNPWENPSAAQSAAEMTSLLSPATSRQSTGFEFSTKALPPFAVPLVRPSSAGSSRAGSSAARAAPLEPLRPGDPFAAAAAVADAGAAFGVSIPLTHTHAQKQRWPDSHGAQTLSAWLQRTSSSGSGSGSEGREKPGNDRGVLQRCASAPHQRDGGNSSSVRAGGIGGGGEAEPQPETEEERAVKRRLLNREYAKRSRQRQHERFVELESQVNSLAAEKRAVQQRLGEMEQVVVILQEENARLRQVAAGRYSRDMAEIVRAIHQAGGASQLPAAAAAALSAGETLRAGPPAGIRFDSNAGPVVLGAQASAAAAGLGLSASAGLAGARGTPFKIETDLADIETAIGGTWRDASAAGVPPDVSMVTPAGAAGNSAEFRGSFPPAQVAQPMQNLFGEGAETTRLAPASFRGNFPSSTNFQSGNFQSGDFPLSNSPGNCGSESEMMIFAAAASAAATSATPAAPAGGNPFTVSGRPSSGAFPGAFSAGGGASPGDAAVNAAAFGAGDNIPAFGADIDTTAFNPACGNDDSAALLAMARLLGGEGGVGAGEGERGEGGLVEAVVGMEEGSSCGVVGQENGGTRQGNGEMMGQGHGQGQGSGGEWREQEEDTLFAMIHHLHRQL